MFDDGRIREAQKVWDPTDPDPPQLGVALLIFQNVVAHWIICKKIIVFIVDKCQKGNSFILCSCFRGLKDIFPDLKTLKRKLLRTKKLFVILYTFLCSQKCPDTPLFVPGSEILLQATVLVSPAGTVLLPIPLSLSSPPPGLCDAFWLSTSGEGEREKGRGVALRD